MNKYLLSLCMIAFIADKATAQVGTASPAGPKVASPTPAQLEWLNASPEQRIKIAERLGEQGAEAFAAKQGYTPLLTQSNKVLPQGLDQVYRAKDGTVVAIEAKGGTGALGHAYGHPQATPGWAIEAAKRAAKSSKASAAEREAALAVLEAARDGKLVVQVVRTKHVLGEPVAAVLEATCRAGLVESKAAVVILEELQAGVKSAKAVSPTGNSISRNSKLAKAGKVLGVAGVVVDGGLRINSARETEQKYQDGQISNEERVTAHAKNAAGYVGSIAGAWVGAKGGTATGGTIGAFFGPFGIPVGAAVGGTFGAVAGYLGGERACELVVDSVGAARK